MNRIQNGTKGNINILFRLEYPTYAYIEDGEPTSSEIGLMYFLLMHTDIELIYLKLIQSKSNRLYVVHPTFAGILIR